MAMRGMNDLRRSVLDSFLWNSRCCMLIMTFTAAEEAGATEGIERGLAWADYKCGSQL